MITSGLEVLWQSGEDPLSGVMNPANDAVVGSDGLQLGTVTQPEALVAKAYPK